MLEQETDTTLLLSRLSQSQNLYEQVELLQALVRREGAAFVTGWGDPDSPITVQDLIEDTYSLAASAGPGGQPCWAVVRRAAGLCRKNDVALSDAITDILVRQKQITVGKAYCEGALISRPLLPGEIMEKICEFGGEDVRERVLSQEILIYLALLIKSEPHLFSGLLTLRVGYLVLLITSDLANDLQIRQEEAYEHLMHFSPSEIQHRLRDVLLGYDMKARLLRHQESLPIQHGIVRDVERPGVTGVSGSPPGGWLRHRQREGALNRVPAGFYPGIWKLLGHCKGLVIGDKLERRNRLESDLILSEMTAGEKNFALWIEHLLNKIDSPEYRELNIEALMELASLADRSPDLVIDNYLVLDVLIGHSVRLAWLDRTPERTTTYDQDKVAAWKQFYQTSPQVCGTYTIKALQYLASAGRR